MKYKWKRMLAVVFLFIIVAGWYVTVCGIGPVKPIQDRMKLGLDIKGGVYVVMEAKTDLKGEELQKAMEQTQAVIEERVNQMGLAEPVVTYPCRTAWRRGCTGSYRADRQNGAAAVCTGRRNHRAGWRQCKRRISND